jgi:hypothetical protein
VHAPFFCFSSFWRLEHVRNSIDFRPSAQSTRTAPASPAFPRRDLSRTIPPHSPHPAASCTNAKRNFILRLAGHSYLNRCLRYPAAATTARLVPACWWDGRKAARGRPLRSSRASAQVLSSRPLPLWDLNTTPLLSQMYTTIDQADIFEKRLVFDALADTKPLQNLIAKYVDAHLVERLAEVSRRGRALVIVTTDLDAGVPVIWNIGAVAESGRPEAIGLIRKILLASASIPPPVMFDTLVDGVAHQEMHVDGGASMQTFLYPAALQVKRIPNNSGSRSRTAYDPQRAIDAGLGRRPA